MKKLVIVEKNNSGSRIDKFLKEEVFFNSKTTRGEIIRNIKQGTILVNDKIIKPSYPLKEKDEVAISLFEKPERLAPNKDVEFEIVYEDANIVVINKPAGLQVHPGSRNETDTLASGLLSKFPEIKTVGDEPNFRPGIVHRLDRDTSGTLIAAKNQETFLKLKNKFKNREIVKTYWAVVRGKFRVSEKSGKIDTPIARSMNYKKQVIARRGTKTKIRPAVTEYKVLKEMREYSLLEAVPKTGRTHQIRVHLSSLGHPIVGDNKYKLKNTPLEKKVSRHLLHAKKIQFEFDGKFSAFETDLPNDFRDFLSSLERIVDEKPIKS